jgi:molybdopterin-guanine dinucleotide biosynthesis protein A
MKNKLLGVVLCGGESKRMGRDKGLLEKDGQSWAATIAGKLAGQGLEVIISINEQQKGPYREIFPDRTLIVDHITIKGPLNGLLSVHQRFPGQDLLLMACDLTEMDEFTLGALIGTYQEQPDYEYYVYRHNGFAEPFCAIYTAVALAAVLDQQESGELKKYSLHERFETGNTCYLTVDNQAVFSNFNHPA